LKRQCYDSGGIMVWFYRVCNDRLYFRWDLICQNHQLLRYQRHIWCFDGIWRKTTEIYLPKIKISFLKIEAGYE
jgi:hypothetical protein